MTDDEIKALFREHWKPGFASIAPDELAFIRDLIIEHRPKRFLEIGMASGMSAGFIARFMAENGGEALISLDFDDTFFGDTSKPNGFLVPELYPAGPVSVALKKFHTSLDLHQIGGKFDMVFIDANHQHPWPAIDTLAVYPRMRGAKIVVHHDLRLFMQQEVMYGIGPKYLFDQIPEGHRITTTARQGNIFGISLDMPQADFERRMSDLLKLPWSLRAPLPDKVIDGVREMLEADYSVDLLTHFDRCVREQNF